MRTISETALYGKICSYMILKWLRSAHSLKVPNGSNKKSAGFDQCFSCGKNKVDSIYCGLAFSLQTFDSRDLEPGSLKARLEIVQVSFQLPSPQYLV